jgi:hypothetical protein
VITNCWPQSINFAAFTRKILGDLTLLSRLGDGVHSKATPRLDWQKPYYDAVCETDRRRLPCRIVAAEWAMTIRERELSILDDNRLEPEALERAQASLKKREKLMCFSWTRPRPERVTGSSS